MCIRTRILNRPKNLNTFEKLKCIMRTYKSVLEVILIEISKKTFFPIGFFLTTFLKKRCHFIAISTKNLLYSLVKGQLARVFIRFCLLLVVVEVKQRYPFLVIICITTSLLVRTFGNRAFLRDLRTARPQ